MAVAFYLLLGIGLLGFFDVLYFHRRRCRLNARPECQREVLWHTLRHLIYALQFLWVANLRFHGAALLYLVGLYLADIGIAWLDVWDESDSRRLQGGLPRGEYFTHVVLSLCVGVYLMAVCTAVWSDRLLRTAVLIDPPHVPPVLRALMTSMSAMALVFFLYDFRRWFQFRRQSIRVDG